MTLTTRGLMAKHGYHEYQPGEKAPTAGKRAHYPCRVCGKAKRFQAHGPRPTAVTSAELQDTRPGPTSMVDCPMCAGRGKVRVSAQALLRALTSPG